MPWNDEGEEGETITRKNQDLNNILRFSRGFPNWLIETRMLIRFQNALERRRRGRGNYQARKQGSDRHTNPLPSHALIGALNPPQLLAGSFARKIFATIRGRTSC